MDQVHAAYMESYMMRGQHAPDRACTRYRYDIAKTVENNEISTGPGQYRLGVPNAYGNAVYVSNPTIRMQKWGASHDMSSTKTDVESDLRNLARPSVRTVCGQYTPDQGVRNLTAMPEEEFPRTYERLVDPPCTLRGTGWNRWEWLCQNPQENIMIPFEHGVDSQLAQKDGYYQKLTLPLERSQTVQDHRFICSNVFVEPAVPVARPQVERQFSDAVSGLAAREVPKEPIVRGARTPLAVPVDAPNPYEKMRREQGILAPPTPFPAFIAPH
jgi:hypothetical protein